MKEISNHSRAIVGYLDYRQDQYTMFKVFLNSIEMIDAADTDLIIFYHPAYDSVFGAQTTKIEIGENSALLFLIKMEPLANIDIDFQGYPYINSIACLTGQDWLKKYTYILKTDLDVVLTDKWNSHYPEGFETGLGAYNHDLTTKRRLSGLAERLQLLSGNSYLYNIGSSWYGKSEDVISVAAKTILISRELLTHEFKEFEGEWPGFFKGVTSLYASEIAINHLIDEIYINSDNLDYSSDSQELAANHTHIHFAHCSEVFSKHAFLKGNYNDIDVNTLDKRFINQYCLFCALTAF
jgi:hypothetical protein